MFFLFFDDSLTGGIDGVYRLSPLASTTLLFRRHDMEGWVDLGWGGSGSGSGGILLGAFLEHNFLDFALAVIMKTTLTYLPIPPIPVPPHRALYKVSAHTCSQLTVSNIR